MAELNKDYYSQELSSEHNIITIHLAYAETSGDQHYKSLTVCVGTTLIEALIISGWLIQFQALAEWCGQVADIKIPTAKLWHVGIYAKKQPLCYELQHKDRIEIYRSLNADPMSQRKSKTKR